MNTRSLLSGICCVTFVSQCIGVKPYSTRREAQRTEQRDRVSDELRGEYERGLAEGKAQMEAGEGLPHLSYLTEMEKAYADGFTEGYSSTSANGGRR